METEKRAPGADLSRLDALRISPGSHHLFQALRIIEAAHPDRPRLGRSRRPAQDPVRLGQAPELAFPRSTVTSLAKDARSGRERLTQQAFGLFGPHGALPLHLTEYARDRQRNNGDGALVGFADMLHHRMLSLFYRAWASAEPAPSNDRPDDHPFGEKLDALAGVAGEAFECRDTMHDSARRHFAGLLGAAAKSEAGLAAILRRVFAAEVEIESFVGSWLHLEPEDRGALGGAVLGRNASLGNKVWSREAKFRLRIGPLSLAEYERLLPGGQSLKRLAALVRNYAGDTLDWEATLVLRATDVPPTQLGAGARLGLTSWIGERPEKDADDLSLTAPQNALP
ncbi:type VI secretion system baseplate subunit TssG [Sulfitobacter sp. LCG007]